MGPRGHRHRDRSGHRSEQGVASMTATWRYLAGSRGRRGADAERMRQRRSRRGGEGRRRDGHRLGRRPADRGVLPGARAADHGAGPGRADAPGAQFVAGSLTLEAAAEQLADENGITRARRVPRAGQARSRRRPTGCRPRTAPTSSRSARPRVYVTALERQLGGQLLLNEGTPTPTTTRRSAAAARSSSSGSASTAWTSTRGTASRSTTATSSTSPTTRRTRSAPTPSPPASSARTEPGPDVHRLLPPSQRCG